MQSGDSITQYAYNGLGHRVSKQVGSQLTRYILDINGPLPLVLAEVNGSGQPVAYHVYGPGVGLVAKITPQGETYYYHYDGSGNTVCMTNSAGNVVNQYAYDEFGSVLGATESIPNPFRYVGRYGVMDEGNGLLFMRARYYDVEMGRFLQPDPVNLAQLQIMKSSPNLTNRTIIDQLYRYGLYNPQTLNGYNYVGNNPIIFIDPLGLYTWPYSWQGWAIVSITGAGAVMVFTPGLAVPGIILFTVGSAWSIWDMVEGFNNAEKDTKKHLEPIKDELNKFQKEIEEYCD